MRRRGHQSDGVEYRAAANGDNVGMSVDRVIEQRSLLLLNEVEIRLDLLGTHETARRPRIILATALAAEHVTIRIAVAQVSSKN